MSIKDVTNDVWFEGNDDECLPLTKCVCGQKFNAWNFIISIYNNPDYIDACPNCGRKFFFGNSIRVYELVEDNDMQEQKENIEKIQKELNESADKIDKQLEELGIK